METNWAAANLQTIRTLMERSAIYRRALAPVMTLVGLLGTGAAIASYFLQFKSHLSFIYFWVGVCATAMLSVLLLIRRQALKSSEPFWTPPTRRVVEAMLPAFALGGLVTLLAFFMGGGNTASLILPPAWMALYGCALHAGGFFMPRGVKWLAWAFILGAALFLVLRIIAPLPSTQALFEGGAIPMGASFGGLHLAYGIYLYFTEKTGDDS
jgi:hypothetical protein